MLSSPHLMPVSPFAGLRRIQKAQERVCSMPTRRQQSSKEIKITIKSTKRFLSFNFEIFHSLYMSTVWWRQGALPTVWGWKMIGFSYIFLTACCRSFRVSRVFPYYFSSLVSPSYHRFVDVSRKRKLSLATEILSISGSLWLSTS